MTEANPLNVAFAALRSAIPSSAKAVNVYQRALTGTDQVETLFAFHDRHGTAQAALDRAQRGDFIRGVTFARGLNISGVPPTAFIVADAFETDTE